LLVGQKKERGFRPERASLVREDSLIGSKAGRYQEAALASAIESRADDPQRDTRGLDSLIDTARADQISTLNH
jgi:hypothetical protein